MHQGEYFSELAQDVTYASRQLWKSPGFSIVAILTLALGIGATTAIFSAVHAVVLRPLAVPDPDRIVAVYEFWRGNHGSVSAGNFVDGVAMASSFSQRAAVQYSSFNVGDTADTERVIGARTTAGFFGVFSTPPALGRTYAAAEDQPGREQVVVLSHRLWTRRFGSDPSVVGRQIRLSGRSYEVIGIMPLANQLFSVKPHDPVTFGLVTAGLAAIALVASLVPAARAASVDPTKALHTN